MSSAVLGCIADDFTGATDLAALLARSGARVKLHINVPDVAPATTDTDTAIEIIALKCRTIDPDLAVEQCLQAFDWLSARGAKHFFWKYCSTFDSTAKGNIGPVAEALMARLDTKQTIYCPAFPENGRSIFMGNLYVGQQPLAESPMRDHPLTPMHDSNLMRLLEPQVKNSVGLVDRLCVARGSDAIAKELQQLQRDGVSHVVTDAVADDDLYAIAEASYQLPLLTGGSALAMPLPELYAKAGWLSITNTSPHKESVDNSAVILSGSCSAMTRQQVAHYLISNPGYQLDPIKLAADGCDDVQSWLLEQSLNTTPLLYATAEPDAVAEAQRQLGTEKAGELLENALAQLAVTAREQGRRRFVVAGGESSGAVTQALGVSQLDIGAEIAPGVPWTYCASNNSRIALSLKSGNFGAITFFNDALAALK